MLGAIAGDIIGSVYEFQPVKTESFPLFSNSSGFTDDTVLTAAIAESLLSGQPYGANFREFYQRYPYGGYGLRFLQWVLSGSKRPYNSFGNGSAMRVSPVGWAFADLETTLAESKQSAEITHNHPWGIAGAQATAGAIFLARTGESKRQIKKWVQETIGYPLNQSLAEIRPNYVFDETCQGSVPQAISAFLESESYEDAVRKAVSLGGDADTQACIAGSIAEAFYGGVPQLIAEQVLAKLDEHLKRILYEFQKRYLQTR